jgi:threonine/homoserine/homoserine lactone efflux protein
VAARKGLINNLANPKLAVFFVALFPQFLTPEAAVLPAAAAMAGGIVAFDLVW